MRANQGSVNFDLDTTVARRVYSNRRGGRYISAAAGAVFLLLTLYGLLELPGAVAHSAQLPVFLFGLILVAFFTQLTIFGAIVPGGKPPSVLTLTDQGVEFHYPSFPHKVSIAWSARRFDLTVRDFRGHATPASDIVQVERVGHAPFWLQPPTAPLTPAAFDTLLARARERGLAVTQKKGGTVFNTWPNSEIRIRRT